MAFSAYLDWEATKMDVCVMRTDGSGLMRHVKCDNTSFLFFSCQMNKKVYHFVMLNS